MRGRKPKPTQLKLLQGNPGCRPIREEVQPTVPPDVPAPPAYLTGDARELWELRALELHTLGLLTTIDEEPFAILCQAYGRWRDAERALARLAAVDTQTSGLMIRTTGGNAIQNPLVGTANKAMRDFIRYAAEFGLTPSARARIAAGPTPQRASKFGDLLA